MNLRSTFSPGLIQRVFIVIIIFFFTFPNLAPDYTIGLDPSYTWGLNYLFITNYDEIIKLLFPIGPLGFLKMPVALGNNLLWAVLFVSIIKLTFIVLLLELAITNLHSKAVAVLTTLIISYFVNIDLAIIGVCFILVLFYMRTHKLHWFVIAVNLAVIGIFVKTSIGISSFSIIGISILIDFYINKNIRKLFLLSCVCVVVVLVIGLLVFHNPVNLFQFFIGAFHISSNYSSAGALYPSNNWFLLILFALSIAAIPLVFKTKESRIAFILLLFPLFAMWKHSISRQDIYHYYYLLHFLFFFWGILIFTEGVRFSNIVFLLPAVSILTYYHNGSKTTAYQGFSIEISGVTHFVDVTFNYNEFKNKMAKLSALNIQANKLEPEVKKVISNSTIDFYPWELTYAAANNLNWKPRSTLQSVTSYSNWLDIKNSVAFERNEGPEFVLFHYVSDKWKGKFGSIDGRYVLNDEPNSLISFLNNYSLLSKHKSFLLFRKNNCDNLKAPELKPTQEKAWGAWINVPENNNEITRLKVVAGPNFAGKMKEFFYKGEAYFVDYKLDNDSVLSYRFIPSNAKDGIWINPLISNPLLNEVENRVIQIRLRNTNQKFVKDKITIQIETISLNNCSAELVNAASLFLNEPGQYILEQRETFEATSGYEKIPVLSENAFSYEGKYSNKIDAEGYSFTWEVPLEKIWNDTLSAITVEADFKFYTVNNPNALLIFSLENSPNNFWESTGLENKGSKKWKTTFFSKDLTKSQYPSGLFKVYVWNKDKSEGVFIDNFNIRIKSK